MFPALFLGFTILLLLYSQLYFWGSPFFFFCIPNSISGVHHSSAFQTLSLGFTILLLHSQLYFWGLPSFSSSAFPTLSLGFTILLLLRSQLYLWGSPFFFFCVPNSISVVHHSSSSFPALFQRFTFFFFFCIPSSYFWGSPFFFFFCVPSSISGDHHSSSSSSVFPALFLGFTILLLLLLCPSSISGVHHSSSSSAFPALFLGFTILLLLLCSQLYFWGSPFFFFFCVPNSISGVHFLLHSQLYLWSSPFSSAFPVVSLGFTFFFFFCVLSYISGVHLSLLHSQLYLWGSPSVFPAISLVFTFFLFCVPSSISGVHNFWSDFCTCDRFFNPTTEVVTFHLRGWCMLGVFLLPAFTSLGHKCQDLSGPCDGMHVCTD